MPRLELRFPSICSTHKRSAYSWPNVFSFPGKHTNAPDSEVSIHVRVAALRARTFSPFIHQEQA